MITRPDQRFVLVPTLRAGEPAETRLRRYRLARLRVASLRADTSGPHGHLKRAYD